MIDQIASVVAILFFILGFAGIALVVASASQGRPVRRGVILTFVGITAGIIFFIISIGILVVGPTQRAVVFNNLTGNLENPREPGISVIVPGIQVPTMYRVSRQEYTMSGIQGEGAQSGNDAIEARSRDGQEVFVDVTIIYTIDPENVNTVHENWSDSTQGFEIGLIRPQLRSIIRDVIALAEAEQIFGSAVGVTLLDDEGNPIETETETNPNEPQSREEVQTLIEERATVALGEEGFTVIDVLLREINFSDEFIAAIEQRQVAELERDRASVEAERVRIEAGGRADAAIEEARGEAEAVRIRAQAEAEALRLVSEQIAANPNLIQYTYIETLADNVSLALVPSNSPFLFNFDDFTQLSDEAIEELGNTEPVINNTPAPATDADASTDDNSTNNSGN